MGAADVDRWEFNKGDESLAIVVNGPLVVNDMEMSILAAIDGVRDRQHHGTLRHQLFPGLSEYSQTSGAAAAGARFADRDAEHLAASGLGSAVSLEALSRLEKFPN